MNKRAIIGIFIAVLLLDSSWTVFAEQTGSIESVGTVRSEGEVENTDLNDVTEQNVENDGEGAPTPEVILEVTMEAASASELTAEPTLTVVLTSEPTEEPSTTPEPTDTPTPESTDIPTPEPTTTPTPEETTEPRRGPLRDSEPSISATVTWGDMNFTYGEAEKKWSCEVDSNKVDVLNNSDSAAVTVTYSYDAKDGFNEYGMSIFDTEIQEYAMGSVGVVCTSLVDDGTFTSGAIAVGDTDTRWFIFTEAAGSELGTESFPIGTLNIVVSRLE
ncbi:MAG: hypothetical protein IKF90_25945 [Parasporobacterium sp.]|nr:hypothetical protein [Parasporobacterium sp.]